MPEGYRPLLFATLATLVAGFVDAVGYAHLGGLFLSFMSGNSTRLGIQLAEGHGAMALFTASVIGGFVAGAFVGTLITDAVGEWKLVAVLGSEVVLFALAAVLAGLDAGRLALLPVALAMGMQNSVHQIIAGADIGKSFVTGALFGFGQALARWMKGRGGPVEALAYAGSWASFVTGAGIGALLLAASGLVPSLVAACLLLAGLTATAFAFHGHLVRPIGKEGGD
ncbi:YoaK family protein [Ancylobacter polymorphus]|uniref:Oxalate decarboxylase n=1 Tax=Ancylobacter polymorphus TaxID=223390 RepID=A0ABU0B8B9_9HYPH|nr:YoaK family protein [Ancylobacter polymorphus]MDQ0302058.1 oxalate decarboxylase [Ancylobacter polymorphus]